MAQIFRRSTNVLAKFSIVVGALVVGGLLSLLIFVIPRSPWVTDVGVAKEQVVPFSHKHHVGGLGLDCRYCHFSVEQTAFAGIPAVKTCMTCHSQIWTEAPILEPIRESWRTGKALEWTRVHDLPDFVYFNHSIHVNKGVGCATCHGRIDRMNLTWQASSLQMEWCLNCHRNPEKYVRPRDQIFNMAWKADDQATLGEELVQKYQIRSLTNCSTCHR